MAKFNDIYAIEGMTEQEAQENALEVLEIKGHNVYLIDLEGYFGYSALVFKDGHHIKYANDYELHHRDHDRAWMRQWYVDTISHKLYTEDELETVTSYDDYTSKDHFLRNYYCLRYDYISAFHIFHNKEEEEAFEQEIKGKYYNPVCFGYFDDEEIVKKMVKMLAKLETARAEMSKTAEFMKDAFYKELCNHEYCINWQGDYDVFSCFGRVTYGDEKRAEDYMNELKFTQEQKNAFYAARREYSRHADEYC